MRKLLGALALAAALTACGAPAAGPAASPTPSVSPNQLTVADDQRTVTLHAGESLEVALQALPGFSDWSHPTSSNPAVLAPQVDPRAAAVRGVTLASFKAVGRGQADLQAAAGMACSPGTACPALARAWQVHVVVS